MRVSKYIIIIVFGVVCFEEENVGDIHVFFIVVCLFPEGKTKGQTRGDTKPKKCENEMCRDPPTRFHTKCRGITNNK